jgi:hypothetical protein
MTRPYDVLVTALPDETLAWLDVVVAKVAADPSAIRAVFPLVGRRCGRDRIQDQWTADEAVRAVLLTAVPADAVEAELAGLYRHGDRAEQRAVLRALDVVDGGETGLGLVREGLRSNDTALIAAALGPFGAGALQIEEYRQAVLKCVFNDIPLERVARLPERADGELARMMADFACERVAAGRAVPSDIWPIVRAFPADTAGQRAAIDADITSPVPARREAAARALADLAGVS